MLSSPLGEAVGLGKAPESQETDLAAHAHVLRAKRRRAPPCAVPSFYTARKGALLLSVPAAWI